MPGDCDLGIILSYSLAFLFVSALMIQVGASPDSDQDQAVFGVLMMIVLFAGPFGVLVLFIHANVKVKKRVHRRMSVDAAKQYVTRQRTTFTLVA